MTRWRLAGLTWLLPTLLTCLMPPLGAVPDPQTDPASTSELEWQLLEAETAVAQKEPRLAASHYRAAIREADYLLGLLALADDDLESARHHFERARNVAAADLSRARVALALVELRLGGSEHPLRELRLCLQENPGDVEVMGHFARALWAAGQDAEYAAVLATLHDLAPDVAAGVGSWATPERPPAPLPNLGSLDGLSESASQAQQGRLIATLRRAYGNLKVLGEVVQLEHGVEPMAQAVEELGAQAPKASDSYGTLDVTADALVTTVAPPRLEPVQLLATEPEALQGVLNEIDGGRFDAAELALRSLIEQDSEAALAAQSLLGRLQAHRGETRAAFETLHSVLEIQRRDLAARQALARLHWQQGDHSGALRELRLAADIGPLDRDLAHVLAKVEAEKGRLTAARRQWVSLDKRFDSVDALLHLAEAARAGGGVKQGLDFARRAVQLAPNSEDVLGRYVDMAWEAQLIQGAAQQVEPLVRMRPQVAQYRLWLGRVWAQRRQMGEASEALLKAVELNPDYTEAMLPLGLALNHESRFAEGRGYLERFLEAYPEDLDALAGLAESEERLGEAESAERRALGVLAQDDRHARAHLVVGLVRAGQGEFAGAREAFQRAVDIDPWMAKAHYQISLACARLRDRDCAKAFLQSYKDALEGPAPQVLKLQSGAPTMQKQPQEMQPMKDMQPKQMMQPAGDPGG